MTRGTLPLLRRFIVWAAIEKNFFDFYFSDFRSYSQNVWIENIFFIFFVTSFLFGFILDFIQNICRFNSLQVFTRYSSSVSFYVHHVWIARFLILNFDSFLLVIFPSYLFRLVSALQFLCFNSSTLYLFDSSACYKQTFMLI